VLDQQGTATTELITTPPPADAATELAEAPATGQTQRALLRPLVRGGEIVGREPLAVARDRHRQALAELPGHALQLSRGYPAIPTAFQPDNGTGPGA